MIEESKKISPRVLKEESVISALLLCQGKRLLELGLTVDDFSDGFCRKTFEIISELKENYGYADYSVVSVKCGNSSKISQILNREVSSANINCYSEELKNQILEDEMKLLRSISAQRIIGGDDPLCVAIEVANKIQDLQKRYSKDCDSNDLTRAIEQVFRRLKDKTPTNVILFDWPPIDTLTFGLLPGEYLIIAARPSIGKTAFALFLMKLLAKKKTPSFFLSLEMGGPSLVGRFLAQEVEQDTRKAIRQPQNIDENLRLLFLEAQEEMKELAKYVKVCTLPGMSFQAIANRSRIAVRNGAKILFLDYLQLLEGKGENRNAEVERISRNWKYLLKELQVPGIMLSQLSRKCEEEKRFPVLSDLRDSGAIEQDADIVWFLASELPNKKKNINPDVVNLLQMKGRDHGIGGRILFFKKDIQTFAEMEKEKNGE